MNIAKKVIKGKRINRASLKSRRLIIKALLELMEEQPFAEITIKEITDRAELVRRTFYGHFSSKEDVLRSYIDGLDSQLEEIISDTGEPFLHYVIRQFFTFWSEHASFLRMLKNNGIFLPFDAIEGFLNNLEMTLPVERWKNLQDRDYSFSCAFMAGGLLNLLYSWIDRSSGETSEEMAEAFISLIGGER